MLGSQSGGRPFEQMSQSGEPIIGFRVAMARYRNDSVVHELEPIYASDGLVVTPSMIVARPGYAVGGLCLAGDRQITAVRVVFMRLLHDRVDPKDMYQSDWQGDWARWNTYTLGANGDIVTGIYGRQSTNLGAFGLILRRPLPTASAEAN